MRLAARARLAGVRALRRPQLGGLERARRRAAHRPRRHARDGLRRDDRHRHREPGGQRRRQLTPFLAGRGRMFTGGHCASVGLGGFLLQGGQGWNSRRWGWACENVVGLDVVTAEGELVHADENENADLYWAARGCRARVLRAWSRASTCARTTRSPMFHDTLDVLARRARAAAALPARRAAEARRRGRAGGGRDAAAAAATAPCCSCTRRSPRPTSTRRRGCWRRSRRFPAERSSTCAAPTTIAEENVAQTLQNPEGHRYAADSQWTDADAADAAPVAARRSTRSCRPSTRSRSGTAGRRRASCPTWRSRSRRNVYLATYAIWTDPADDERHRAWVHGHHARLAEIGDGVYVGDSDFTRRPDRFLAEDNRAPPGRDPRRAATPTAASAPRY